MNKIIAREMKMHFRLSDIGSYFRRYLIGEKPEGMMEHIFVLGNSSYFFTAVEFGLFLQNFYVAFWATQLIPLLVTTWSNQEINESEKEEIFGCFHSYCRVPIYSIFLLFAVYCKSVILQAVTRAQFAYYREVQEDIANQKKCIEVLQAKQFGRN